MSVNCGKLGGVCDSIEDLPEISNIHSYEYYKPDVLRLRDVDDAYAISISQIGRPPAQDSRPAEIFEINQILNSNYLELFGYKGIARSANRIGGSYELYAHRGPKNEHLATNNICTNDMEVNIHPLMISHQDASALFDHFPYLLTEFTACQYSLDRKEGDENLGTYSLSLNVQTVKQILAELKDKSVKIENLSDTARNLAIDYLEDTIKRTEDQSFATVMQKYSTPILIAIFGTGTFFAVKSYFITDKMRKEMKGEVKYDGDPVKDFSTDLIKEVRDNQNRIDSYDRALHQKSMDHIVSTLMAGKNPILVGDAGVGKSVTMEIFADMVSKGEIPRFKDTTLIRLNLGDMIQGSSTRGSFEAKLNPFLNEIERRVESGEKIIVLVDEGHRLLQFGAADKVEPATEEMKTRLTNDKLVMILATTTDEYKHFDQNPAFKRRFMKVNLSEPPIEAVPMILRNQVAQLEKEYKVRIPELTVRTVVQYSDVFITDISFPANASERLSVAVTWNILEAEKSGQTLTELTPEHVHKYFESSLKMTLPSPETLPAITTRSSIRTSFKDAEFIKTFAIETGISEAEARRYLDVNRKTFEREIPRLWVDLPEAFKKQYNPAGSEIPTEFVREKMVERVMRERGIFQLHPQFKAPVQEERSPRGRSSSKKTGRVLRGK